MKKTLVKIFAVITLLCLSGCAGEVTSDHQAESTIADDRLTMTELIGTYDISYKNEQEAESATVTRTVNLIVLNDKLSFVVHPIEKNTAIEFDSYDEGTKTAMKIEENGDLTTIITVTFSEKNGQIMIEGSCVSKKLDEVEKNYTFSGQPF